VTVNKATLTIKATNNSKTVGQTATDTGTLSGVVNNDGIKARFSSPGDGGSNFGGVFLLDVFVAEVRLVRGRGINATMADAFVAEAQQIISAVG
jgi:hypothetical protein